MMTNRLCVARLSRAVKARAGAVFATAALALSAAAPNEAAAQADNYPSKPIKWVVAYPAGGGLDAVTRMLANDIAPKLEQPLVIENRTGASGTIGASFVAKSAPDGYTFMTVDSASYTTAHVFFRNLNYNAPRDLPLIATTVRLPVVLVVNANNPAKNFREFLDNVKATPGKITYASPGIGSPQHIGMELFQTRTGTSMLHVPYKSVVSMLTDVSGGQVEVAFSDYGSAKPFLQSGKLRMLAVATETRPAVTPDVPTFDELGVKNVPVSIWHAIAVPVGMPPKVVARLSGLVEESLKSPQIRAQLANIGAEPFYQSGKRAADFGREQAELWEGVVRPLNIKLD